MKPDPMQKPPIVDEDAIYATIAKEIASGSTDQGLWTRLFAEYEGVENQIKAAYIKQRAEKLIALERARLAEIEQLQNKDVAKLEIGQDAVWKIGNHPYAAITEIVLGLTALLAFAFLSYSYWGFIQDDAYVILRYAQNLLSGNGLVFNQGERVEGYTELLWTLLATAGLAMGLSGVQLLKVLSMIFGLLAIGALWAAGRKLIRRRVLNVMPAFMWALSPSFVLWSQGGLGTTLISFLLVAHFVALLTYCERPTLRSLLFASFLIALALLSRPEAGIYLILSTLIFGLYTRAGGSRRDVLLFAGIGFGTLLAVFIFRLAYFGEIQPNTYYAKVSTDPMQWIHGIREFWNGIAITDGNLILFAAMMPLIFWRRHSFGVLWLLGATLLHSVYYIRIGGDLLPHHRLYQPAFAFLYLIFVIAISIAVDYFQNKKMLGGNRVMPITIALLICLGYGTALLNSTLNLAAFRNVQASIDACHSHFGRYVENNYRPGDKIAVYDVGATSYYAKSYYVVDLLGLTDHTIAKAFYDNGYNYWLGYLSWQRPEYQKGKAAFESQMITYFRQQSPRFVVTQVNVPQDQIGTMRDYVRNPPPLLNELMRTHIPFEGGIFRDLDIVKAYRIVEIVEYNPFAYFVLLERRT